MDNEFDKTEEPLAEPSTEMPPAADSRFFRGFLSGFLTALLLVSVVVGGAALGRYMAKRQIEEQLPAQADNILTEEFIAEINAVYQRIGQYFLYGFYGKNYRTGCFQGC